MSGASYGGRAGYGNNQQPGQPALGSTGGGWSTSTNYTPGGMGSPMNGSAPPMGGGTMTQLPGASGTGGGGAFGQTGNMVGGQPSFGPNPLFTSGYGSYQAPETPQAPGSGWNLAPVSAEQGAAMHMHGLQGQANYRAANPNAFDASGNPLWQQQAAQNRAALDARNASIQPWVNHSNKPMIPGGGPNVTGDPYNMGRGAQGPLGQGGITGDPWNMGRLGVGGMGPSGPFNTGINGTRRGLLGY